MGLKPGYKRTEVGLIPEAWDVAPLRDLVGSLDAGVSVNSVAKDKDSFAHDESVLKTSCVLGGRFFPEEHKKIVPRDVHRAKLNPRKGSIIISRANTLALVGECGYVERDYPTLFLSDKLWMTHLDGSEAFCVKWLVYLLSSGVFKRATRDIATGTSGSMKNVSKASLISVQIPVPPKVEQEAIADSLSDADALIKSLERLIARKRHLKRGVMQQLLTGKKRLPGFSGEWEVRRFADLAQPRKERIDPRRTGVQDFCIELEHIERESGRFSGSGATREGSSLKAVFRCGDVLFGKLRAYLRKYWLADRAGVCSTEIWVLVAKLGQVTPEFLFQLVMVDRFIEVASTAYGTHMPRSDWNLVKNYEVALPRTDEQTAIATVLSDIDAEIAALEAKLAKARQIKQGMMHNLLTGRIRLV